MMSVGTFKLFEIALIEENRTAIDKCIPTSYITNPNKIYYDM